MRTLRQGNNFSYFFRAVGTLMLIACIVLWNDVLYDVHLLWGGIFCHLFAALIETIVTHKHEKEELVIMLVAMHLDGKPNANGNVYPPNSLTEKDIEDALAEGRRHADAFMRTQHPQPTSEVWFR
jgi:hypothetical protein